MPVSLGTVYRAMNELEMHGLLLREWGPHRRALYRIKPAGFDEHRLRLVCQGCGRGVALTDDALLNAVDRLAQSQGLSLAGTVLAIPCECRNCRNANAQPAGLHLGPLVKGRTWPKVVNNG